MEPTLDQVREELADIHDELLATAPEDFDKRSQLKEIIEQMRSSG